MDLTRAQTAALEAFEEAGVHGRIEEVSFARYSRRKRANMHEPIVVHAYLCEVSRLDTPQEPNRNRTWFSPEEAKTCLREGRMPENGSELARVLERAVARILRLRSRNIAGTDALQEVRFEACGATEGRGRMDGASFRRHFGRERGGRDSAIEFTMNTYLPEVLRLNQAHRLKATPLAAEKTKRHLDRKRASAYLTRVPHVIEGSSVAPGALQNHEVIPINKPRRTGGS